MDQDELRKHIKAAAPHGDLQAQRLAGFILRACWPRGPEHRDERAAREWIRNCHPDLVTARLPVCSCSTGRCMLCN
jgi:hypothetical protein